MNDATCVLPKSLTWKARAQAQNASSSCHHLRDTAYPTQWWCGVRHVQVRPLTAEHGM